MTLALTKTLDPADYADLAEELEIVEQHFTSASEQHPARKWEYALALRAITTWAEQASKRSYRFDRDVDVGGAHSPFWRMTRAVGRDDTIVVDPAENYALADYMADFPRLSPVVTCLSVLEHVDDLDRFLYHLGCLVAPGGLLFLTMDCCEAQVGSYGWPTDTYHFHWMRQRIFTPTLWRAIGQTLGPYAETPTFSLLGAADWTYHGAHVYDYTFASLALVKRP